MALYQGEEMVDVTTPDGRTLSLPRSIVPASMLPQIAAEAPPLAPAALPLAPTTNAMPEANPESVTGGEIPTAMAPPPDAAEPVQNSKDRVIGTVDNSENAVVASNKAYAQKQKAQAAQAASPAGRVAAATNEGKQAITDQGAAALKQADIEAAGQDIIGNAYAERNKELDKLFKKREESALAELQLQNKKLAEMEGVRKKIADTKIDREIPWMNRLGAFLIGLGQTINKEKVTTAQLVFEMIDRKVAEQMKDLDNQKQILGFTKDELAELRTTAQSKLALNNLLISGASEKAARQVEEIAARVNSQKAKANGQILAAQLRERSAALTMDAVKYQLEYEQKDRAEKNQNSRFYAGLRQADRHHADDVQLKREDMYLDAQKALAASKAKGDELAYKAKLEMIKDNETRGIRNTVTGDELLTPRGRQMLTEADKLVEEAKAMRSSLDAKSFNPDARAMAETRARALEEKAAVLRGDAKIQEQVRHRDPTQAGRLADQYSIVQNITTNVDKIKELYEGPDGGKAYVYNSPVQQEIASRYAQVLMGMKDAQGLGVLSKADQGLLQKELGMEPTSEAWTVGNLASRIQAKIGKDPEGFKRALDAIVDNSQNEVTLKMKATNFGGTKEDLFYRRTPGTDSPSGKAVEKLNQERTPLEVEEGLRKGGPASTAVDLLRFEKRDQKADKAAESGSLLRPGLSPGQEKGFDTLMSSYKSGNARDGELLVSQVTNNATSRPQFALAMIRNLREHAPELYEKARAAIKAGPVAEQLDYEDTARVGAAMVPTGELVRQVLATDDEEGRKELARRVQKGDKEAQKAVLEIAKTRKRDASMPKGSVFREGR